MTKYEYGAIGIAVSVLLIIIFFFSSVVIVGAGKRGVLLTFGKVESVLEEGLHFKIPFMQKVEKMDVQTQKFEVRAISFSRDLQTTDAKIALNFHIAPNEVNKLYQEIGMDYESRILAPAIQESVKQATANFTAQELIEKRSTVKDQMKQHLSERLLKSHIIVDDVSIANFDFSDEYEKAIEQKQVAQQGALKAENDLNRIKVEAQQTVEKAKAESESIRIRAQALKENPEVTQLNAIEKWDGKLPQYMTGVTPFINLSK